MNRFVLDASVALAWCFEDENGSRADEILDLFTSANAIVPAIWPLEVGNALLAGERRKRIKPAEISRSLELLRNLDIQIAGRDSRLDMEDLVALARAENLSVYDAAYLFLAMREGVPLATMDRALEQSARRIGVPVL